MERRRRIGLRAAGVAAGCLGAVLLLDRLFPVEASGPEPAVISEEPAARRLPEVAPMPPDWFAPRLPRVDAHVGDVAATILHLACWSDDMGNTTAALSVEGEPDTRLPAVQVAEVLRKRIPSDAEQRVWRSLGISPARLGGWVAEALPWAGYVGARVELDWIRRERYDADPADVQRAEDLARTLEASGDPTLRSWAIEARARLAKYDDAPFDGGPFLLDPGLRPRARWAVLHRWCDDDVALDRIEDRAKLGDLVAAGSGTTALDRALALVALATAVQAGATTSEIASWYALVLSTTRTDAEHGRLAREQAAWAPELRTAAERFAADLDVTIAEVDAGDLFGTVTVFGPLPEGWEDAATRVWGDRFLQTDRNRLEILAPDATELRLYPFSWDRFSHEYEIGLALGLVRPRSWEDDLVVAAYACEADPWCGLPDHLAVRGDWLGDRWSLRPIDADHWTFERERAASGIAAHWSGRSPDVSAVELIVWRDP